MLENDNLHKLLKRQIKRHLKTFDNLPPETTKLLNAINQAYFEFDEDLKRSELILDQSMKELFSVNVELKKIAEKKTEEAENADHKLQTIVASVSEIIFQLNNKNELSYLNPAWERLIGYDIGSSLNTNVYDYVKEEDIKELTVLLQSISSTEKQEQKVIRLKTKNNEIKWVQITGRVNKNKKNENIGISGIMTDVTKTYLTQQENNRLALFAQKTQNMVITTNTKGEIEWANKAFTNVTKFDLKEVVGKKPGSFLQGEKTNPETITLIREKLKARESFVGEIYNYDKLRNGYWIELSIDPIIDKGKHLGFIAVENIINERKQQQEKLEHQKYLLNEAQSLANIGSWEYNALEDKFSWSDEMYNILSIKHKKKVSRSDYFSRIHPEDVDSFKNSVYEAFKTGKEKQTEHRIITDSGKTKFIRGIGKPILNSMGEFVAMRGSVQDITSEKESEEQLIKYQNELDEAQLLSKMGSFEYNATSKKISWSKYAYAVFNLSDGNKLQNLNFDEYIHPEDKQEFNEVWRDVFENKKSFNIEYRFIPKKGSLIYLESSGQSIINEKGEIEKIVGTVQNITERKEAELAIKINEEKYRNLLETMDLGILEVNNDGIIVNAFDKFCEMLGYSKDELIGKDPNDLFVEVDQLEKLESEFNNRKNGVSGLYELELTKKDGTRFWVLISGTPLYDRDENMIGSLGIHMDITERKKAEQQLKEYTKDLEKINSELDQFAYIVSHDLKAPLRAINNLSIWIEEDIDDLLQDETKEYFTLMRGRVNRMENLINGILEYSRAGRMKMNNELFDLNEFLANLSDSLKMKNNVQFVIQKNLPKIKTEKLALEQVFSNFISNAIKYNDKEEILVEIGLNEKGEDYEFYVKDNGPGIDKNYHQKIFQIFQTLQARDKLESTGVGLAIVKKIIDEKDGSIRLDSEMGKGTTVYFTWKK